MRRRGPCSANGGATVCPRGTGRAIGAGADTITVESLSRWLHLVPCVTGYGGTSTDADRRIVG